MSNTKIVDEKEFKLSGKTLYTLEIAGAAIFGALSVVVSVFITPLIPRVPGWFIAIVDPISIIWITCLLIFGVRSGFLCLIIGTVGLMPWDPYPLIGPPMKFSATFSLVIVSVLFLKLYKREEGILKSQKFKKTRNYIFYGLLGIILRILVMLILNIIVFLTIFADFLSYVNLKFLGLPNLSGWTAIFIGAPIINAYQSVIDLVIPYLIVFGTKLDKKYEIW